MLSVSSTLITGRTTGGGADAGPRIAQAPSAASDAARSKAASRWGQRFISNRLISRSSWGLDSPFAVPRRKMMSLGGHPLRAQQSGPARTILAPSSLDPCVHESLRDLWGYRRRLLRALDGDRHPLHQEVWRERRGIFPLRPQRELVAGRRKHSCDDVCRRYAARRDGTGVQQRRRGQLAVVEHADEWHAHGVLLRPVVATRRRDDRRRIR